MRLLKLFKVSFVFILFVVSISGCSWNTKSADRNPYKLDLTCTLKEYKKQVAADSLMQMVDLEVFIKGISTDIRYATADNFTGKVIYTAPKAFARKAVASALLKVQDSLKGYGLGLKIFDAYRPYAASLRFFEVYPDSNFVANPRFGSRHNRGCAIDLTLVQLSTGKNIPMPTEYDDFSPKAHSDYSNLPDTLLANKKFLFGVMSHFGFNHYLSEWWHFDFIGWEEYKLMDLSFDELEKTMK